ncbi:hypothetical protein HY065_00375 [Candidatus Berkelbacteria bacterium]|nr:hypothetical protein [Candidatus Berkelbacteria bacterium]
MGKHLPIFGLRLVGIDTGSARYLGIKPRICGELGIDRDQQVSRFVFEPIGDNRLPLPASVGKLRQTVNKINTHPEIALFHQQTCSWIPGPITTDVLLPIRDQMGKISYLMYLHLVVHLSLSYCVGYGKDPTRDLMERIYWKKPRKRKNSQASKQPKSRQLVLVFNMAVDTARISSRLAEAARKLQHHFQGGTNQ